MSAINAELLGMDFNELNRRYNKTPGDTEEWRAYVEERDRRIKNARRFDLIEADLDALLDLAYQAHDGGEVEVTLHTGKLFRIAELLSIPDEYPEGWA